MSASGRVAAAVRMMTPPVKPSDSRNGRTMPRSRLRSSRASILLRHAHVVHRRHEHEEPPRHRRVRGEPGALGPERLLDDLHQDFLARLEQRLDLGLVALAPPGAGVGRRGLRLLAVLVPAFHALEGVHRVDDVGHVEEPVAIEPDVDKRRLHAGQHLRHAALVDVAHDAALALAFNRHLDRLVILEDGDHGLVAVGGDNHFLVHQFVNLRILTLRMSPTPARVAITDDPP